MLMTNVKTLVIGIILILALSARAESPDGLSMLKNDANARASGLGAACVSITGDPNLVPYNPAAAIAVGTFDASFGHTIHWDRIRFESAFFGADIMPRLTAHGAIRFAAVDDLEKRGLVPTDEPEALFDAHDISFKAGAAYAVTEKVTAGAAFGWFIQEIEGYRGSAFNLDLGAAVDLTESVDLGLSVTSLGSDFSITKANQKGSRDIALPTAYRMGVSYHWTRWTPILAAADIVHADDDLHLHLGAEAQLHKEFHLRAGYRSGYDTKNFSAGASFTRRNIRVDYAFLPFSDNLGTSHLFNLTFSL